MKSDGPYEHGRSKSNNLCSWSAMGKAEVWAAKSLVCSVFDRRHAKLSRHVGSGANNRHSVGRQTARDHWFGRPSNSPAGTGHPISHLVFMDRLLLTIIIVGLAVLVSRLLLLLLWVG